MIEIKKKEGEPVGSFLFRFNKKVKQSGVLKELRKRKNRKRGENRKSRRDRAIYRTEKNQELSQTKKYGNESSRKNS